MEFRPDEHGGVTVLLDGFPQSYVSLADPGFLPFEYVQHLAACLDVQPEGPLAVTHVGGAGLALARYVQFTRPGSPQIVLEPDEALTEAVRRELPLPRGHRIRVRGVAGAAGTAALKDDSADAIVVDAFAGGRIPADLTTTQFFAQCARVLRRGPVLCNLTDEPGLHYVARVAASAAAGGCSHRAFVATHDILKGRRFGNVVLVASAAPLDLDALERRLRHSPYPTGLRGPAHVERLARTARPLASGDAAESPPPPPSERWRAR